MTTRAARFGGASLHTRLSVMLLGLLSVFGGLGVATVLRMTRLHQMEVAQSLNRDLARQIAATKQDALLAPDGAPRQTQLAELFHWLMVVNPSVEFYVLDTAGDVIGYDAAPGAIKRQRVALEPVTAFLGGEQPFPIFGDDPRDPGRRKVFSAAAIPLDGPARGYLYVILAGEQVDSVAQMLEASYVLRLGLVTAAGYVLLAALVGVVAFRRLTRPLRNLQQRMRSFQESEAMAGRPEPLPGADELTMLEQAFDDLTARIEAQMAEIRRTEDLRRELVANVSHDLRTPLAAMQGYLETLAMKGSSLAAADRERYLETALGHGERLGRLVDELFQLSKLEAKVDEPHPESFSLAELIQDSVQGHRQRAARAGVTLEAVLEAEPAGAFADIGMMQRVLDNLIDNAVRAASTRVEVRLARAPRSIGFEVADDGPGIDAAELPHVFDRFFRGRGTGPQGSGLGLAISRRIVELHHGAIEVSPRAGGGTTFIVTIPAVMKT